MGLTEEIGAAHRAEVDLRGLRCLICGLPAEEMAMRVTQVEDGGWVAVCDDCCEFFGAPGAWRRAFGIYDAVAGRKRRAAPEGKG